MAAGLMHDRAAVGAEVWAARLTAAAGKMTGGAAHLIGTGRGRVAQEQPARSGARKTPGLCGGGCVRGVRVRDGGAAARWPHHGMLTSGKEKADEDPLWS